MNSSRLLAAAVIASLLAACQDEAPQEGEATGEVLEGTISDDMLPLDQLRSEAPLADPTGTGNERGSRASDASAAPGEAEDEPDASPADEPGGSED